MHKYVIECEYILDKLYSNSENLPLEILKYKDDAYNFVYVKGGLDYIHAKMLKEGLRYLWKAFRLSPGRSVRNTVGLIVRYFIRNQ